MSVLDLRPRRADDLLPTIDGIVVCDPDSYAPTDAELAESTGLSIAQIEGANRDLIEAGLLALRGSVTCESTK